jgi:nitroreductase
MEVKEAVTKRRSIRAFEPKAVPKNVLKEIMEQALWAPSWGDTQPWGFTIVSAKPLELIKEESRKLRQQGAESHPELTMPQKWNDIHTMRYQNFAKAMFDSLDIGREEKEKRNYFYQQLALGFGCPHMIYLHLHQEFNQYSLLDCGLILQTIALLAVEQGLGTCIMAGAVLYPEVVRKYAQIPPDRILVVGMAIGYPIKDHPSNLFRSQRGKPEEFIQWVDG